MVVEPDATGVTGTLAVVDPAAKVTVAGTVATEGLLELRLTMTSIDGGPDRVSVRFCGVFPVSARLGGVKLMEKPEVTCTCALAGINPPAEAVMVADPRLRPVIFG
jgi:hypothetical protein